jgi:hypothetical protein
MRVIGQQDTGVELSKGTFFNNPLNKGIAPDPTVHAGFRDFSRELFMFRKTQKTPQKHRFFTSHDPNHDPKNEQEHIHSCSFYHVLFNFSTALLPD